MKNDTQQRDPAGSHPPAPRTPGSASANRRRCRRRAAAALLTAAAGLTAVEALNSKHDETPVASEPERSSDTRPTLECPGQSFDTEIDVVPPDAGEPTKNLPSSAAEAARDTLAAPWLSDKGLSLGEGVSANRPDGMQTVYYPATASDGSVRAVLTVQELTAGVWATTAIEQCSDLGR